MPEIIVKFTPPDLPQRMQRYPGMLDDEMERTMKQALAHIQGSVPPYPSPPPGSSYIRTGTLGRSIGLGGRAQIYEVKKVGGGYEARLGTNLSYAPYVIGEQQASVHSGRWWTMKTVAERARPGVIRLFNSMCERLVQKLGG